MAEFALLGYEAASTRLIGLAVKSMNRISKEEHMSNFKNSRSCLSPFFVPLKPKTTKHQPPSKRHSASIRRKGCLRLCTNRNRKDRRFLLPMMQRLSKTPYNRQRPIRALVLSPTRGAWPHKSEKVSSDMPNFCHSGTPSSTAVSNRVLRSAHSERVDVLVATPGRLLDLHGQGYIKLESVSSLCSMKRIECSTWDLSTTSGAS